MASLEFYAEFVPWPFTADEVQDFVPSIEQAAVDLPLQIYS
jgi:hypothetical protein